MVEPARVTELEFVFNSEQFALGRAAAETGAAVDVELVVPRSDAAMLAFVRVRDAPTRAVERQLQLDPEVDGVHRYDASPGPIIELVMTAELVTLMSDGGAVVTQLSARRDKGRLVADVPPHAQAAAVIERFVAAVPSASLVARRQTDRHAPQIGQSQFVTRVLAQFTQRQLEVLRVAYDAGYFEWPREAKADEVAEELGIATPTFSQHLRAAERSLTRVLFEG